jgi:hypothetical protein
MKYTYVIAAAGTSDLFWNTEVKAFVPLSNATHFKSCLEYKTHDVPLIEAIREAVEFAYCTVVTIYSKN